ncbi:hypothetical protein PENNAL_c0013G10378 [Penicillium nalgiovense]|uniref:Uncharacterized protein n=1 Tax=Penicillium nalgiovense TaxID=60175 RepID=A0A1V6YRD2_PENNA|nr:hypothetical protein PENNAL_c0013G10378 [Penicillium nalgiovense]
MAQVSNASKNDRPVQISATDGIPTAKRRNWSEAAGSQIETLNLGPVDRTSILEHLISNVRLQVGERYFSVLEEHRRKNMGLHYAVWGSAVDMKSAFVTLAILDAPSTPQTQLVLNLAEMWMCLVF